MSVLVRQQRDCKIGFPLSLHFYLECMCMCAHDPHAMISLWRSENTVQESLLPSTMWILTIKLRLGAWHPTK